MSEPTTEPEPAEPAMTSGVIDDVEAVADPDQSTTVDLSDLEVTW